MRVGVGVEWEVGRWCVRWVGGVVQGVGLAWGGEWGGGGRWGGVGGPGPARGNDGPPLPNSDLKRVNFVTHGIEIH